MSYYTVSHLLQGEGNVDGQKLGPLGIAASDLTDEIWNYIFKKGAYPSGCTIDESKLQKCREEFEFWYPLDLRVSGKDLVRNHLTMSLYNHAAIWPDQPEKWPRSFFTNGHLQTDNQKMSKSTGNFISLSNALSGNNVFLRVPKLEIKEKYVDENTGKKKDRKIEVDQWEKAEWIPQSWTVDSTRFALSEAGDTMSDGNFQSDVANNMILALENQLTFFTDMLRDDAGLRTGDLSIQDHALQLRIDECILEADSMYAQMKVVHSALLFNSNLHQLRLFTPGLHQLRKYINFLLTFCVSYVSTNLPQNTRGTKCKFTSGSTGFTMISVGFRCMLGPSAASSAARPSCVRLLLRTGAKTFGCFFLRRKVRSRVQLGQM
jgi:hypothetical protein